MQKGSRILGLMFAICLCASVASAGPLLSASAYFDGVTTWKGTRTFNALGTGAAAGKITDAYVEYAVYAPGMFNNSVTLGLPNDPSNDTQYVYAYQLFNTDHGAFSGTSPYRFLTGLSVGLADLLAPPFDVNGSDPEQTTVLTAPANRDDPGTSLDKVPSSSNFGTTFGERTSAIWNFSPALSPFSSGTSSPVGFSNILIFTSPWPPEWDSATVKTSGGPDATDRLPSPVPEPTTIVLAAIGVATLLFKAARQRLKLA